jgi:hypothetical protein
MKNTRAWCCQIAIVCTLCLAAGSDAQQLPDLSYTPAPRTPTFAAGGPTLLVDEGHNNGHTLGERLVGFAKLVSADGFVVRAHKGSLESVPEGTAILMIANAGPTAPDTQSAFTDVEITAIHRWVEQGGALLLIADHMPRVAPAARLAQAFGVQFTDGFTLPKYMTDLDRDRALQASYEDPAVFTRTAGTLKAHAITDGRSAAERIHQVATFTGQGFNGQDLEPLLVFPRGFVSIFPATPWDFRPADRRVDAEGSLQGAVKKVGKGRAAFFGEAAMFTAQTYGPTRIPMGLNHPRSKDNPQFILNVLHWLVGR